jgi:integral membrane protein
VSISSSPTVTPITPERAPKVRGALKRYRVLAYVTGVVLAFMTVVGLPMRYLFDVWDGKPPLWYVIGWMAHGWLFVVYLATVLDLAGRCRWTLPRTLLVMIAGTVPFASFVAERWVHRDVEARIDAGAATANP